MRTGHGGEWSSPIVLTAPQELVLSDSKKVHSVSNPAFHRGNTSILYRTLSCKQLPQNQHGVRRCPSHASDPGFFCCPPTHTHSAANYSSARAAFFSFFPFFTLTPSSSVENGFLIKELDWNYYTKHTAFKVCIVYNMWIFLRLLKAVFI